MASTFLSSFFFNDTATTEIYTLSLHDALPIWTIARQTVGGDPQIGARPLPMGGVFNQRQTELVHVGVIRSEEHTSELQSHSDLVCRLLLEKKKKKATRYVKKHYRTVIHTATTT